MVPKPGKKKINSRQKSQISDNVSSCRNSPVVHETSQVRENINSSVFDESAVNIKAHKPLVVNSDSEMATRWKQWLKHFAIAVNLDKRSPQQQIHLSESETIPTFRDYGINKLSLLRKEEEAIPITSTLGMLSEKANKSLSEVDKEYERSLEEEEHKTSSQENEPESNSKKEERNSNVLNSEEGNSNLLHSEEKTEAAKSTEEVLQEPRRNTDSGEEMIDNNGTERITESVIKAEEVSNIQEEGVSPTNLSEIDQMWPTSSTALTDSQSTNQDK